MGTTSIGVQEPPLWTASDEQQYNALVKRRHEALMKWFKPLNELAQDMVRTLNNNPTTTDVANYMKEHAMHIRDVLKPYAEISGKNDV